VRCREASHLTYFGTRPLKRAIQRELQDPLPLKILSGEFHQGDIIKVDRGKEGLVFKTTFRGEVVDA
jgi:ATP-dependent Clp protease ATP-binding subunit ClpB